MGQSSISMLNKVGYSMFWSSMWDSKTSYSRNLKEDLFFSKFFDLIFNDSVSANMIRLNKKKSIICDFNSLGIDDKNNSLFKYLENLGKLKLTSSKLWVLKYQKWIIFYKFVYINEFEDFNKKKFNVVSNYGDNFFYTFKFYNKACSNIFLNYKLYKKHVKNFTF